MHLSHVATIAGTNEGPLRAQRLAAIAVDAHDRLFVLGAKRVQRYSSDRTPEHEFSVDGSCWSLLTDADYLWIGLKGGICRYDLSGERVGTVIGSDHLGRVTALAILDDDLFVADATHRAIYRYSRNGERIGEIGAKVNRRGFMIPNGLLDLARDPNDNTIVVAHSQKSRVERYNLDGALVDKWGRFGMHAPQDFGGCCNPTNIATAADGMIAVSEKAPPRIKLYDSKGQFQHVTDTDVFDPNTKNIDLAFDSRNHLYASDPRRRVVEVFELTRDESEKSS
ncbi:MAG: hypothetical protein KDB27_36535 [Planctomycetales bacterium]|nr:hypothetical protein [Planctomycetales bacterium]